MKTNNLKVIGSIVCECGLVANVEQTNRRGGFVQVRCKVCGVDARTGKTVQQRHLDNMRDSDFLGEFGGPANQSDTAEENRVLETINTIPETITDSKNETTTQVKKTTKNQQPTNNKPVFAAFGLGLTILAYVAISVLSEINKTALRA